MWPASAATAASATQTKLEADAPPSPSGTAAASATPTPANSNTNADDLDPFTTIYRGRYNSKGGKRYHLNPACPALGPKPLKGRLGAVLLTGRRLCSIEGGPRETMPKPLKYGGGRVPVAFRSKGAAQ